MLRDGRPRRQEVRQEVQGVEGFNCYKRMQGMS